MPRQTHQTALKLLARTEYLQVSVHEHQSTVNERLADLGPAFAAGEGGPDWKGLQQWAIRALGGSVDAIRKSDRNLRRMRVRLADARRKRDAQVDHLCAGHRALRKSFEGTYGRQALALVGLDSKPLRALLAVREQMREVVLRMRNSELGGKLPQPLAGQADIALEPLAALREAELKRLESCMRQVDELGKQTDEVLIARNRTLDDSRRVYANVGRMLEGLYRLVGLDELADRIRLREPARRAAEEGADGEAEPEESASLEAEMPTAAAESRVAEGASATSVPVMPPWKAAEPRADPPDRLRHSGSNGRPPRSTTKINPVDFGDP